MTVAAGRRRENIRGWFPDESTNPSAFRHKDRKYHKSETVFEKNRLDRGTRKSDFQLGALLRAAILVVEDDPNFIKYSDQIAQELNMSVEWVYRMALIEFIESRGGKIKETADSWRRESPYWQFSDQEPEEMSEDSWSPELAEKYKDLLSD